MMNSKNKSWLVTAILLPACVLAYGQKRDNDAAMRIAHEFQLQKTGEYTALSPVKLSSVKGLKATGIGNGQPFHIFNEVDGYGYVIVSGDESMMPVLGYSDNGTIDADSISPGLLMLLECYNKAYENCTGAYRWKEPASKTPVAPMIQTHWAQGKPFNKMCPYFLDLEYDLCQCVTGCVATSMSQVMKYHNYPSQAKGKIEYTSGWGSTLSLNLNNEYFDWAVMSNDYTAESGDAETEAVARLMRAAGHSVYMNYGIGDSGASASNVAYALINNFGYNPNICFLYRDFYTDEEWLAAIDAELDNARPVLYGGIGHDDSNQSIGHSFIIDGRDSESRYHLNFGWNGREDGYFVIDDITGGGINFNTGHHMYTGISKETIGTKKEIFYSYDFDLSTTYSGLKFSMAPICFSSYAQGAGVPSPAKVYAKFGIATLDNDFNITNILCESQYGGFNSLDPTYLNNVRVDFKASDYGYKEGDEFYIAPYAKGMLTPDQTLIKTANGREDWYKAVVRNGKVELSLKGMIETPKVKEGYYRAMAYNSDGTTSKWSVSLIKDNDEDGKYWIGDIDPAVAAKGYTYEKGWNKVYAQLNEYGSKLTIPANQKIGDGIVIKGYGDNDDVVLNISETGDMMEINQAWGSLNTGNGESGSAQELSKYTSTTLLHNTETTVEKPVIDVKDGILNILCATEEAVIYFTADGTTPTTTSTTFTTPVTLKENCTVKAVAAAYGKMSEIATLEVKSFYVPAPEITANGNSITIGCSLEGATIFYTVDGSTPSKKSTKYTGPFTLNTTSIVMAVATKDRFNDSEVVKYDHIAIDPAGAGTLAVNLPAAGKLSANISEADRQTVETLIVSGDINGDDILCIKEMASTGKLKNIDLTEANIVSGGSPYYQTSYSKYETENNVVGPYTFNDLERLLTVRLPRSVTKVKSDAFRYNTNLIEIQLPENCKEIENRAFVGAYNLERITLPASVEKFTGLAFFLCRGMKQVKVAEGSTTFCDVDGVVYSADKKTLVYYPANKGIEYDIIQGTEKIGNYAFSHASINKVSIPVSVTGIGNSAFDNCSALTGVEIPGSVTALGDDAFSHCNLTKVEIISVKKIPARAFSYNPLLTEVKLGKVTQEINGYALDGCEQLKRFVVEEENPWLVTDDDILFNKDMSELVRFPIAKSVNTTYYVPETVERICNNAFSRCTGIKQVIIPDNVKELSNNAFSGSTIETVTFGPKSQVMKIGSYAFQDNENIETIILPDGVETIPTFMASSCRKLSLVQIPAGIKKIDSYAFHLSSKLSAIRCFSEDPGSIVVGTDPFKEINRECTWYVPAGTAAKYRSCAWWVSTWKIEEISVVSVGDIMVDNGIEIRIEGDILVIDTDSERSLAIYDISGRMVRAVNTEKGTTRIPLAAGAIYVVNGKKFTVQ